ncbi:hypothetical protein [Thermoflexus sp.]|uniref:hypothetical protein n=1 Tax=Thermoflexus sp. TaxID=1969742 RepID=UPI0026361A2E|nr:hypothetical protein [Thermoflexus sp.]MCX7690083.1 hypothetical protein [Thermoflexus sp.]
MSRKEAALPRLSPRVLLIVFDPPVASNLPLSQARGWNRVEELVDGYIADLEACSGGLVRYQIAARLDFPFFPVKIDGFQYTWETYRAVLERRQPPHEPDTADYRTILDFCDGIGRIARGEIDELWLFGGPYFGFYESRMAGPGAFWCNAPPLLGTEAAGRRFVIMGFSYERGVGEMLENFGHRAEAIMERVFAGVPEACNLWRRFTRYELIAPGQAEVGTIHFAPNSERDYDWGNPRDVWSYCDDWLHFPDLRGRGRWVNCAEWGGGDIREHHRWWLRHLPRAPGETDGISHNWWRYIVDPNTVPSDEERISGAEGP